MDRIANRVQFRRVLKDVVKCLRQNLDRPGVAPLNADQVMFWFENVTLDDVEDVVGQLDADHGST